LQRLKNIYKDLLENPVGRISRSDFWIVYFFQLSSYIAFIILLGDSSLVEIVALFITVTSPLFQIKRYHDSGHVGWWVLVPIANFVLLFYDSTDDNRWGSK
jgi:uncharacterized membrane protein YhaH (DUF805 family)